MKILITILTLTSALAFGATRDTAYNIVCKNMTYDSDRSRCIETIRPHNYFDDQALNICANFTFDSTKNQCIGYMAGKQYEAYEIDACKNATFDSEKLNCLKKNGRPVNDGSRPCLPRQEVLGQLQAGLSDLRVGNLGTVDRRLQYLIANFSNPSCQ
jgi:hypothetical protein